MQGSSSTWGEVHVGVPQGSILGPLFFSIYMKDLPTVTQNCELNLYADGMAMHSSSTNLSFAEHGLQEDLNFVYSWLCVNLLSPSIKKSGWLMSKTSTS